MKPLGKQLKGLSVYAGATIMGDGRVALILDVLGIGQRSGVLADREKQNRTEAQAVASAGSENQRMLLFRAGSFARLAVPLSLVARLEEFPQAQVERAGGRHVVQYRGGILTMVSLASVLEPEAAADTAVTRDPVQAIVFADGKRSLGIMVDQIVDIVDEAVSIRQSSKRLGLLGSAVVGKQVTDFLDVRAVVQAATPEWLEGQAESRNTTMYCCGAVAVPARAGARRTGNGRPSRSGGLLRPKKRSTVWRATASAWFWLRRTCRLAGATACRRPCGSTRTSRKFP